MGRWAPRYMGPLVALAMLGCSQEAAQPSDATVTDGSQDGEIGDGRADAHPNDSSFDSSFDAALDARASRPDARVDASAPRPLGATCSATEPCVASAVCERMRCVEPGFAYVPAGTFTMGAPPDEKGFHDGRENGQHTVILTRPLLVQKTEVTQGQWHTLMGNNPSFHSCGNDCPMEMINFWEMLLYANALSASKGLSECYQLTACEGTVGGGCPEGETICIGMECDRSNLDFDLDCDGYRLPTEAEWEYFARAGTQTAYITASGLFENYNITQGLDAEMDAIAWYGLNSHVTYDKSYDCTLEHASLSSTCGTHPVAQKMPNAWGLYDITGNVWEHVWDESGDYPEPGSTVTDPKGPAVDYPSNIQRRMRGGAYSTYGQYMRVAYRTGPKDYRRLRNAGFRLVRSLPR